MCSSIAVVVHQSNHLHIQELRQTTESLDETLRNTIKLLADTRKDILAIPASTTTEDVRREVKVEDLLAYAKFISKTTVPPTFRKQDLLPFHTKSDNAQAQITNGMATPPAAKEPDGTASFQDENVGTKAMSEEQKRLLNPLQGLPFEPWPSHEVIQRGALGAIQRMIENGQDPGDMLTAEEQAELDRKKTEDEELEKRALEEAERRRMSMFDTGAIRRRPTLDVFDPDDV